MNKKELTLTCTIKDSEDSQFLLKLLSKRFPYHSSEVWSAEIESGHVQVNDQEALHSQRLRTGDKLVYYAVNLPEPEVSDRVEIIFETPDLLLVGKPAGTPVSRTGLIIKNTLVNILRRRYEQEIHLLHRLDRETGGLMLCARSKKACRDFHNKPERIITGKYYLAVVKGEVSRPSFEVELPLATKPDSQVRCRMWVCRDGKPCRTIFHTLGKSGDHSLLMAVLLTGRKHQIRAHLAHLGHPLIGDKIYDYEGRYYLKRISGELDENDYNQLGARNHALHAWALKIRLGDNQPEELFFAENFSADMDNYLKLFPNWREQAKKILQSMISNNRENDDHAFQE